MVGWVGWCLYPEFPDAWQTTTFLAPRWRGMGLLQHLRAHQHALAHQLTTPVKLVTSVDVNNFRSLKASHRYAESMNWSPGTITTEPIRGRIAVVWHWPPQG